MKCLILCFLYSLTCAAYKAPMNHKKWALIKYDKIPSHNVSGQTSLDIEVRGSSSPLVLGLDSPLRITGLNISAKLEGKINYTSAPGSRDNDDFPLRIGLISKGDNSLNFFQRKLAPDWVLRLNKLGENHDGFGNVHTYLFYSKKPKFEKRVHPLSEYFQEMTAEGFKAGKLNANIKLKRPLNIIGIWLSSDGDDTKSSFKIRIEELKLTQ